MRLLNPMRPIDFTGANIRLSFVFVFMILHAMVFAFGFVNYAVKDNLQRARDTFGPTFMIARCVLLYMI